MRVESHVGRAATGGELSGRGKTAGREGRLARRQASSGDRVTPAPTPTVAVEREHRLADGWGPIDALDPVDEPFLLLTALLANPSLTYSALSQS